MDSPNPQRWSKGSAPPPVRSQLPTSLHLYDTPFNGGNFSPVEIGFVSCHALQSFPNDTRNKRYLRTDAWMLSDVNFDLMRGYHDNYIRTTCKRSERAINHILTWWFQDEGQQLAATGMGDSPFVRPLDFDFVSRRGHLEKVFTTPYMRDGWKIAVTLFRGSYFLFKLKDDEAFTEAGDRINYMGHNFVQYMTSAQPGQTPNPSEVLDMNNAFYCLLKVSLDNHSLLLSATLDSEDPTVRSQKAPANYVELKSSAFRGTPGNVSSIKRLRWWAQSFLGGVPKILVGFKRDDRTVVKCKTFEVSHQGITQTSPTSWEKPDFWKPAVCMNFLNAFLKFVKQEVTEDNPDVVYVFSWSPGRDVQYEIKRGREHCFLLPEYVQHVMARYSSQDPGTGHLEPKDQKHDE